MRYIVPVHERDDDFLRKLIQEKFTASLMSDSKWVKLLDVLVASVIMIKLCLVKPIWEDKEPHRRLVFDENTCKNFDYYATAMEAMVSGKPRGWYAYKEIEWLDFPRVAGIDKVGQLITQDLVAISEALKAAGQFTLELTPGNLRLYGYLRS